MPQRPSWYGVASCVCFVLAVVLLVLTSTVFERALAALPLATQRWIGLLTLVTPAAVGVAFALLGLRRTSQRRVAAAAGLVLNALFGLFFIFVLLLAG